MIQLSGVDAIAYIVDHFGYTSYYQLAKDLSDDKLKVQPIQITNYRNGKKISQKVADRILETFDVYITDAWNNSSIRKEREIPE